MNEVIQFFKETVLNADNLAAFVMAYGGLYLVAAIVFAETGLFIGFFLPGDSLLFVTGMMIRNSPSPTESGALNLLFWITLIAVAGIIGNSVGYWFGRKTGPVLFEKRDTFLFKRKHIQQAKAFYEKRGGGAIIVARFVPIVRTFAPIVAGIVQMDRKKFFFYNVLGSFSWVGSMLLCGYFLGGLPWVKNHFEYIVLGIVLITTLPVLWKMIFGKHETVQEVTEDVTEAVTGELPPGAETPDR